MSAMKNAYIALTDPNAFVQHIGDEDMVVISRGKPYWDADLDIMRTVWDVVITKDDEVIYYSDGLDTPAYTSEEEAMASMLSFLLAAAEAYDYSDYKFVHEHTPENIDMFPMVVNEWAYQYMDEISMAELELTEGQTSGTEGAP